MSRTPQAASGLERLLPETAKQPQKTHGGDDIRHSIEENGMFWGSPEPSVFKSTNFPHLS